MNTATNKRKVTQAANEIRDLTLRVSYFVSKTEQYLKEVSLGKIRELKYYNNVPYPITVSKSVLKHAVKITKVTGESKMVDITDVAHSNRGILLVLLSEVLREA